MTKTIDKAAWPRGEWDDEPDQKNYVTASGLKASILRVTHSGALCGYVGVPAGHPWHGKDYSDTVVPTAAQLEQPVDAHRISIISLFCSAGDDPAEGARIDCLARVHGGLTYAGHGRESYGEDPTDWYFGFDCAHSGDRNPAMEARYPGFDGDQYRNLDYVQREVEVLAAQLAAVVAQP